MDLKGLTDMENSRQMDHCKGYKWIWLLKMSPNHWCYTTVIVTKFALSCVAKWPLRHWAASNRPPVDHRPDKNQVDALKLTLDTYHLQIWTVWHMSSVPVFNQSVRKITNLFWNILEHEKWKDPNFIFKTADNPSFKFFVSLMDLCPVIRFYSKRKTLWFRSYF